MPVDELLHELQVHQIELKMQNEFLRLSQIEQQLSRDRYLELYVFSPVAYLMPGRDGMVSEVNLTATQLLGVERKNVINRHFSKFVASDAQWQLLLDRGCTHFQGYLFSKPVPVEEFEVLLAPLLKEA